MPSLFSTLDIETYRQHVAAAAAFVRHEADRMPSLALILGTGLGGLAEAIDADVVVPYDDIPHMPSSTVQSHDGRLIIGTLNGTPVVALQGRMHLYEGYTPWQVGFPIRVLGALGIETVLISNAAGGLNPHYSTSDVMLITDHINFQGTNPLVGPNVDAWGPRFPDMSEPYDPALRHAAQDIALDHGFRLHQGVYLSIIGPNLETRAEYRMIRALGADAVGMSTVPEVLVARHMGIRVLAASVITDLCLPDALEPVTVDDVLAAADAARPHLQALMTGLVQRVGVLTTA
jgi:purine-nucleoside phosphorylase